MFLVQINYVEATLLNMDSKDTGDYHVTFLSRRPHDSKLCDDTARWWPLLHESKNNKINVLFMVLGCCLVQNVNLILEKYYVDSSCYLHGPFNFDSRSDIIIVKQFIALAQWKNLLPV